MSMTRELEQGLPPGTTLAAAIPTTRVQHPGTPPTSPQCCSSVVSSTSSAATLVATPLGIDLTGLNVPVGLSCSPITAVGNNCGGTAVICDPPKEEWGGLIALDCFPIITS
ncbi:hydrophobin 2 [Mycena leptocephala]|nr:hydrophobin 2 [Mycena leptocephala]